MQNAELHKLILLEKKAVCNIKKFKMLENCRTVIIALSGGSDSVALLQFFINYLKISPNTIKLCAAHVNHGIRGENADRDESFCSELCHENRIELFVRRICVPEIAVREGKGIEETARDERYKFFQECAESFGQGVKIATAHTADDNAETVLMNLCRGAAARGLSGIAPVRGNIIRPFIDVEKSEIMEYIEQKELKYTVDETNQDTVYTRNFIRHEILPALLGRFPAVVKKINSMTRSIACDADYLDNAALEIIDNHNIGREAGTDLLCGLPPAMRSRVISLMYAAALNDSKGNQQYAVLSSEHIECVEKLAEKNKTGQAISLPGGVTAEISYGKLIIHKNISVEIQNAEFQGILLNYNDTRIEQNGFEINIKYDKNITKEKKLNNNVKTSENIYNLFNNELIDFDRIIGRIYFKFKQSGDAYIYNGHTRKIKENYINIKMPRWLREVLPIFYDDEGIIWACGLPVADRVRVGPETSNTAGITVEVNGNRNTL